MNDGGYVRLAQIRLAHMSSCISVRDAQGPGLAPGARVEDTTQHVDIAPTVLALAGERPQVLPRGPTRSTVKLGSSCRC
jgi:hypothetical protein